MNDSGSCGSGSLEKSLVFERARLVRLCAKITGDGIIAEDLEQETLLEAWRHIDDLHSQDKLPQWLSGIARNVCLRWARNRGRDLHLLAEPLQDLDAPQADQEDSLVDDFDLEVELERKELIELLDRALALLTPEARALLTKSANVASSTGQYHLMWNNHLPARSKLGYPMALLNWS